MAHPEDVARCRDWLEQLVSIDCRSGLYDEASILAALEDVMVGELGEVDPAMLATLAPRVRRELEARASEERSWTERTTNDRIDDAFADLDAREILTAQALGSTMQHGFALIAEAGMERDATLRGVAFYHRQDLERGVVGQGVAVAFGGWSDEGGPDARKARQRELGREIVHVLRHHGLDVRWDGSENTRIQIAPFAWQKRRVTTAPSSGLGAAPPLPPAVTAAAAPKPAACAICGGKGWIASDPTKFPELCVCKGGKARG